MNNSRWKAGLTAGAFAVATVWAAERLVGHISGAIAGVESTAAASPGAAAAQSKWVWFGPDGRLKYRTLEQGDRIMDFSYAGYGGGGVPIPDAPVKATVAPSGRDDTASIQVAIDSVSRMEPVNGLRGAVLLSPGTFQCSSPLRITSSGVVLRGSGIGRTTLQMAGQPHLCISVNAAVHERELGAPIAITDAYVPSGTTSFNVADASGFHPGDLILIRHPVTAAWIHFMGMDTLVRNGKKERWLSGVITTRRTVKQVQGNAITVDVPLSDCLDSKYLNPTGASIVKVVVSGGIEQVGVESLRIEAPAKVVGISEPLYQAIRMAGVTDGWLRDIAIQDTVNSVGIGKDSRRISVQNVQIHHTVATKGAAKPGDFGADGTQILFDRCTDTGNNLFYFVTGGRVTGPNVLLNSVFHGNGHIQPHQRWATGLLVDNCQVPESGIDFMNRGEMGSGHGWTMGWAVAWNCSARTFLIQQPPGAANWAIGCRGWPDKARMPFNKGPVLPDGIFDSQWKSVSPPSLYLAQLKERLGK